MDLNLVDPISGSSEPAERKIPANIFLTGFMGAGKTSVGKQLATKLGIDFYDTDDIIATAAGMSISKMFSTRGEPFFRRAESELLKMLGGKSPGSCIISTGGGAVLKKENRAAMRKNGIIIFLQVTPQEIARRISGDKGRPPRPLLMTADPMKSIEDLLEKRRQFYNEADLVIESSELTIDETVNRIIKTMAGWDHEK
ncbi:MAG TPA: shikimate kinase [Firmicutes bacterium]|nr:shikimate kinase [Bacillota bacterium]